MRYVPDSSWPNKPDHIAWGEVAGVALAPNGLVYLVNRAAPYVQVYECDGRFARSWDDVTFARPHQVRVAPDGSIWVADEGDHAVHKYTPDGALLMTLGARGTPGCDASHFNRPTDVAIAPDGDVFVSDGYGNRRVAHFDADGTFVREWGTPGEGPGQFVLPHGIAVGLQARVYVADRDSARIEVFDAEGDLIDVWAGLIMPWALFMSPIGQLWVCGSSPQHDPRTGERLVAPPPDQMVLKLSLDGQVLERWEFPKGEDGAEQPGDLNWVHCLAVDASSALYLGDLQGKRLQKFVPT